MYDFFQWGNQTEAVREQGACGNCHGPPGSLTIHGNSQQVCRHKTGAAPGFPFHSAGILRAGILRYQQNSAGSGHCQFVSLPVFLNT